MKQSRGFEVDQIVLLETDRDPSNIGTRRDIRAE